MTTATVYEEGVGSTFTKHYKLPEGLDRISLCGMIHVLRPSYRAVYHNEQTGWHINFGHDHTLPIPLDGKYIKSMLVGHEGWVHGGEGWHIKVWYRMGHVQFKLTNEL